MLVLDANILVRAAIGMRVRTLLAKYGGRADFWAPDTAFQEAREHLPGVFQRRGIPSGPAMSYLDVLSKIVRTVESDTYGQFEAVARERLARRDEDDWPVLASALALDCPIWTEDTDLFGCGIATWTTDRVELYLIQAHIQ